MLTGDRIYTPSTWRLIPPLVASGDTQMAIDRWLLEKHRRGEHPPTLRFYTWHPAAISLGYHQKDHLSAWQRLIWQDKPLDLVRRPTGGKAVLHQGDLTYAVVTTTPPGKRLETYKQICRFLITGWRSLGVELNYGSATREYIANPNCFGTATVADLITATGEKAIGSAQLRRGKAILQHGSMLLTTDVGLAAQIFNQPVGKNLLELIPDKRDRHVRVIIEHLTQAAIACWQIDLVEQSLSDAEWEEIGIYKNE